MLSGLVLATLLVVGAVASPMPPQLSREEMLNMPPAILANYLERYQAEMGVQAREIVGGVEVSPAFKYEFMVALLSASGSQFCGGSLINSSWVLTAAHCTTGQSPARVSVIMHRHNLASTPASEGAITRTISSMHIHPEYAARTYDNDVALWKLSSPVTTLDFAALDSLGQYDGEGEMARVIGWGAIRQGGPSSPKLLEVDVPLMSNADCNRDYVGQITDSMLCAGYDAGGKDSCQGDSGGPLFITSGSSYVQVGVVSWGSGCAQPGNPGVYARVSHLHDWISETIEIFS